MRAWALLFVVIAGIASAKAPDTSLRPEMRPDPGTSGTQPVQLESSGAIAAPERSMAANAATLRGNGPRTSMRPKMRTRAVKRAIRKQQRLRAKGAICGDPEIQGDIVGRVSRPDFRVWRVASRQGALRIGHHIEPTFGDGLCNRSGVENLGRFLGETCISQAKRGRERSARGSALRLSHPATIKKARVFLSTAKGARLMCQVFRWATDRRSQF